MRPLARFTFASLCLIVLAVITHLSVVLLIPWHAEYHAAERLRHTLESRHAELISGPSERGWLPQPDPFVAIAACAFDLAEGPFRFTTHASPHFHSAAFHTRGAGAFFALTDRSVEGEVIDVQVMTREQQLIEEAIRAEAVDDDEDRRGDGVVRVIAPEASGFVTIRVLAPLASLLPRAEETAQAATCAVIPLDLD